MLNLYHLKYFYDAVHAKSLVRAAEGNRVSHPAVSQAIRSLEEKLGVKLMNHNKRRFELTPQGIALFNRAAAIFDQMDETINAVVGGGDHARGTLGIGCSHSIGLSLGSKLLPNFYKAYPDIEMFIRIGNSSALEYLLSSRAIEIGIGVDDGSFSRFDKMSLIQGKFVIVVAGPVKKIPEAPTFLVGDKGPEVAMLHNFARKKMPKAHFIEVQSWGLIAQMVSAGMGWGLIPDYMVRSPPFSQIRALDIGVTLPRYELSAFFRSTSSLSAPAKVFLNYHRKQFS